MLLDTEQQRAMLLQVIDTCNINGPLGQIVQGVQSLLQLRQEVQNARVGACCDEKNPGVSTTKS